MLNGWEIVLILAVVLVLFGAKKLPELARGLGQGIKEFKKSAREVQEEIETAIDVDSPPPPPVQRRIPADTQARTEADATLAQSSNESAPASASSQPKA
ncbi:MAG: twin-arginine translocase TatA/TatE family subunit [Verrucomicrobiota bacterium]